jgi:hypothetical protein
MVSVGAGGMWGEMGAREWSDLWGNCRLEDTEDCLSNEGCLHLSRVQSNGGVLNVAAKVYYIFRSVLNFIRPHCKMATQFLQTF